MLATNKNCWMSSLLQIELLTNYHLACWFSSARLAFFLSKVLLSASFLTPGRRKHLTLQSFLCLSLHLYMTQEVTILQTQFKIHEFSFWLCYAVWWVFTNTLLYKFQPTNMADNKNDIIFFLGAVTLYIISVVAALSKHFIKCSDGCNQEHRVQRTKLTHRYFFPKFK